MYRCVCKPSAGGGRAYDETAGRDRPECRCRPQQDTSACPCPPPAPAPSPARRRTTEELQSVAPTPYHGTTGKCTGNPRLCEDVYVLGCMMDLIEFVAELSLRLDDKGVVLKQVTDDEVAGFCSLVEDVFATWNKDVSDQAARNQRELRDRYQQWTQRLKQRIKANNTWLSQNVPDFDWQQHYQDPEHLNRLCARPMENLKQEEENISQWRKQNFHKLYWLRDQARKANEESDRLVTDLDNSRRKNYKQLMLVNMNREMLHEKHAALQYEVKQLKEKRNKLSDKVGDLFAELENVNRPSSPCLCGESARRSSSSRR